MTERHPSHEEAYLDLADKTDSETVSFVTEAVVNLRRRTKFEALAVRDADFKALARYFAAAADEEGMVRLTDINQILDDAWFGKK